MKCSECGISIDGIMSGPGKCIACRMKARRDSNSAVATGSNCRKCGALVQLIGSDGLCVSCRINLAASDNKPTVEVPDYSYKLSKQPVAITLRKCVGCSELFAVLTSDGRCLACAERDAIRTDPESTKTEYGEEIGTEIDTETENQESDEPKSKRGRPAKKGK